MRVAIVGLPYCGKTTLFTAISGVPRDHLKPGSENLAAVKVPEPRLAWLDHLYKPKKRTEAALELVDLPASPEDASAQAGLTHHLPTLRQSDGLLIVLRAFESATVPAPQGINPQRDLREMREEMLLADLLICDNRIEKLEAAIQKHTQDHERNRKELEVLTRCRDALQNERPLRAVVQPGDEEKLLRSFGFLTQKPSVVTVNVGEGEIGRPPPLTDEHAAETIAVCAKLEAEMLEVDETDRTAFMEEYGIETLARDRIIRACFEALGLITFFTVGDTEVRAWEVPANTVAVDAAGKIHTDMARGFIRAETVAYDDLRAAGSMREAKAAGKVRQEPKTYVVQDGDVLLIKFNV